MGSEQSPFTRIPVFTRSLNDYKLKCKSKFLKTQTIKKKKLGFCLVFFSFGPGLQKN